MRELELKLWNVLNLDDDCGLAISEDFTPLEEYCEDQLIKVLSGLENELLFSFTNENQDIK